MNADFMSSPVFGFIFGRNRSLVKLHLDSSCPVTGFQQLEIATKEKQNIDRPLHSCGVTDKNFDLHHYEKSNSADYLLSSFGRSYFSEAGIPSKFYSKLF